MDRLSLSIQNAADQISFWVIGVLMATALFFTVRLRLVQIVRFREALSETARSRQTTTSGALAPLQTFLTSLAATIGVGNIAGVATAIVSGGPGALFWIWCYGLFAMSTKFAEAALGMHFRVPAGEATLAGPMYYLRDGLKWPSLAWIFALLAGVACLFTTPFTQPNSVAVVLDSQLELHGVDSGPLRIAIDYREQQIADFQIDVDTLLIGCAIAVLTWLVIVGGIKAIGRAAEKLSPLKVVLYVSGGLVVIGANAARLPDVLALVFREAFSTHAVAGGSAGWGMMMAIRYGVMRGVYANEAGYGTAAVVYGIAKSARPEQQGLAAMMEVFIISFVTSSISALSILVTGAWESGATGPAAVTHAFHSAMPTAGTGGWMVAVSVFLFGYSALIGWAYYGEQFFEYLFGRWIILPYRWLYCLLIPLGAVAKVDVVWAWGDILNGLQVFPNVLGLVFLSGLAAKYAASRGRTE
jgi:AGCS family alanine or glycine:cation symporter